MAHAVAGVVLARLGSLVTLSCMPGAGCWPGVNRSDVGGGRATLRIRPSDVWTIDIGGVYQRIGNRDAQYVDAAAPPLTRAVPVAEPSSNDFRMGSVTVQRRSAGHRRPPVHHAQRAEPALRLPIGAVVVFVAHGFTAL